MSLLSEPHHDGSPMYVDRPSPALGESVTVRLRVAEDDPGLQVWIRTTYDAEPVYHECERVETTWWQGRLPVHNPVTNYRFLIEDADGGQRWVSAVGTVEHDPSDAFDFRLSAHPPAPEWTTRSVVYQIFPDRFARSAAADERPVPAWAKPQPWDSLPSYEGDDDRTWLGLYGGDLDGIVEHLDHVAEVGGTTVYLTPVFPAESNHRYNASTFDEVDPLLGGDDAYARLDRWVTGWAAATC